MLRNIDEPAAGASVKVWKSDLITSANFHGVAQEPSRWPGPVALRRSWSSQHTSRPR